MLFGWRQPSEPKPGPPDAPNGASSRAQPHSRDLGLAQPDMERPNRIRRDTPHCDRPSAAHHVQRVRADFVGRERGANNGPLASPGHRTDQHLRLACRSAHF